MGFWPRLDNGTHDIPIVTVKYETTAGKFILWTIVRVCLWKILLKATIHHEYFFFLDPRSCGNSVKRKYQEEKEALAKHQIEAHAYQEGLQICEHFQKKINKFFFLWHLFFMTRPKCMVKKLLTEQCGEIENKPFWQRRISNQPIFALPMRRFESIGSAESLLGAGKLHAWGPTCWHAALSLRRESYTHHHPRPSEPKGWVNCVPLRLLLVNLRCYTRKKEE